MQEKQSIESPPAPRPAGAAPSGVGPLRAGRSGPLNISWDELNTDKVETKLKRQAALSQVTAAAARSTVVPVATDEEQSLWYKAAVYLTLFGLLGGLTGWGLGEIMHLRPNAYAEARDDLNELHQLDDLRNTHLAPEKADAAKRRMIRAGQSNPYFAVWTNDALSDAQKEEKIGQLEAVERSKDFIADLTFYSVCGMAIAMCLSAADALVGRNWAQAALNGVVGAVLGLLGGLAAALVILKLEPLILSDLGQRFNIPAWVATAAGWGALGLFISVGPGLVLRNFRRLLVGLLGGAVGGLAGGLTYTQIASSNQFAGRAAAILLIGAIAGLATGLIEEVAKTGWLKITAGLIAGKQFVLYRNPTYIGSSLQCNIYLFSDPAVGRRHAAIHVLPGGYEIEDLPLGGPTRVNGQEITRKALKPGDNIQIGQTTLQFHEKVKEQH